MVNLANNLYNPAIMKNNLNISIRFSHKQTAGISPAVQSVHLYPIYSGKLGDYINLKSWALEYHTKDAGVITFKEKNMMPRRRRANYIHIYPPGYCYREDSRTADFPLEENYMLFNGGEFCELENLIDSESGFATLYDPEGVVGELMCKAGELCVINGDRVFWEIQSIFMKIIQIITSAVKYDKSSWIIDDSCKKLEPGLAKQVEQYLRLHIADKVTIYDIASYMNVSESSLNHRFKKEAGISPIAYLNEIRINFAKSLLLKGERLVNIADMTGFYDEYHLSKCFKNTVGISPRAFKQTRTAITG